MNGSLCLAMFLLFPLLLSSSCCRQPSSAAACEGPRTVRVAQSAPAEVVGADNAALQQAADLLRPGDTLEIGPGEWRMDNSLVIRTSRVTVQGAPGETILKKGPGAASRVVDCGDYGESVLVVAEPANFKPGMGLSIIDDNYNSGWAVSVSAVKEIRGDTLLLAEMTLRDYDYETGNARVENKFPILCGIEVEGVTFEGITVDGNREQNPYFLDGCRGGAIYLYRVKDCNIRNCVARNYNGDGISFQITDNVQVDSCESHGNSNYGIHPGTGSPRAQIRNSHFHHNDRIGFFLCWRVRYGTFADNLIEDNGDYGISVGHKDTDNLFENNVIQRNGFAGVYFREETLHLAGHRNIFRANKIIDNGDSERGYGIYVAPYAGDLVFENNEIGETRAGGEGTQRYGVFVAKSAGPVLLADNRMSGHLSADLQDENGK